MTADAPQGRDATVITRVLCTECAPLRARVAALEQALREPTEEMIRAALECTTVKMSIVGAAEMLFKDVLRAAGRAALGETP